MRLFVLLRNDPRLDSVQDHVIDRDPVPQVDRLLHAKDTQNLQLDGRQVVEQIVKLDVLPRGLDALVDCDYELIGLLDGELSLGVDNGLDP